MEVDLYVHLDRNRVSILHRRLELVLSNSFHRFLIQTKSNATQDSHVSRMAIGVDLEIDEDIAGDLRLARLFRKFRFRRK